MRSEGIKTEQEYLEILSAHIERLSKTCPVCGAPAKQRDKGVLGVYRCTNLQRKHNFNIFERTMFKNTKIGLANLLKILDCWVNGLRTKDIAWITKINKKSIYKILKRLSEYLIPKFYNRNEQIGGPGVIVEIDESKFGKVKYHRGHRVDGVWVLGMVERTIERKLVLVAVPDRRAETLLGIIDKYVHPESVIYTDCFASYNELRHWFLAHRTVNHSRFFVDPETGVHTNTIEGTWCGVKVNVPIRSRTAQLIPAHLVKIMIERAATTDPLNYLLNILL